MKKRKALRKRMVAFLDLPEEALGDEPKITLIGSDRAIVENHTGVFEYRAELVRFNSSLGIMRVTGECMAMRELSRERICIVGQITGFEYEK